MASKESINLTESGVEGESPGLKKFVQNLSQKEMAQITNSAVDHTGLIKNHFPFWSYDRDGKPTIVLQAGWWISAEENAHKQYLLVHGYHTTSHNGEKLEFTGSQIGQLNLKMNGILKDAGYAVDVEPAKNKEVKVLNMDSPDE